MSQPSLAIRRAPRRLGQPLLGSLVHSWRDPLSFYLNANRRYGDVVWFPYLKDRGWHFVGSAEGVEHVLVKNSGNYVKGTFWQDKVGMLTGNGLLTSEGGFWLRQRRLSQPAFHRQRLTNLVPIMTAATDRTLTRWSRFEQRGQAFDVVPEMMALALQIVGRSLFGADLSADANRFGKALTVGLEYILMRMIHPFALPVTVPIPQNQRFLEARRTMDDIVYRMIREHQSSGSDSGDLLSLLVRARDEDTGEGMTDLQLRDEIMTLLLAGHETTAIAMSWTFYLLARHPQALQRVEEEVAAVLEGRVPTAEDLPNLRYTRMVIEEAMRLYPSVWAIPRQSVDEDVISGYYIPAQSTVLIIPYITHRHRKYWKDPERFDPERFTPEQSAGRPKYAYFPFGGGPRLCLGMHFAIMEAQVALAMVTQRYRLRLVPGHPVAPSPSITLRPRHGLMMTAHSKN